MLSDLHIRKYRGLVSTRLTDLTRINLIVGTNKVGKSSVLEAVEILLSDHVPSTLCQVAARRAEVELPKSQDEDPGFPTVYRARPTLSHLFAGHLLQEGVEFSIEGNSSTLGAVCTIQVPGPDYRRSNDTLEHWGQGSFPFILKSSQLRPRGNSQTTTLISERGTLPNLPHHVPPAGKVRPAVRYVGTEGLEPGRLDQLWDAIVLTPEEQHVLDALGIIEPGIERLAALQGSATILVKLRNSDARIPIGSMGEGIKRLFVLAVHAAASAGGILLIDEVDTGLHHSVMARMWRLLVESARRLNVQVLATTHSDDCVSSMSQVCGEFEGFRKEVSLHRLDAGVETATRYSAEELIIAFRGRMEVRGHAAR